MGLNRKMRKQFDITRTDLHILMKRSFYTLCPRYIIRPVFLDRLSRNVANDNA